VLRSGVLSLCIGDIFAIIIDIWISYGAPDRCVLCIDDIFGSVFTTYGALFDTISAVK
jgi:hypothetical protein